jgi:hypothetical protein
MGVHGMHSYILPRTHPIVDDRSGDIYGQEPEMKSN